MARRKKTHSSTTAIPDEKTGSPTPQETLAHLAATAIKVASTARRHRASLKGANYYADKMSDLRARATNAFGDLKGGSVGDSSALAEQIERVFSVEPDSGSRAQAARDLNFSLKTTWAHAPGPEPKGDSGVFPLTILTETRRGYLIAVGRQANACYANGWYDACAVMMRRLLESAIIEAFEGTKLDSKIKNPSTGDFLMLTELITAALGEPTWNLPRNVKKRIQELKDVGHTSAHNRYYLARQNDIDRVIPVFRETIEAFLHLAGLL